MMKFAAVFFAVVGLAYLMMMYTNSMWHKVAFTTGPTGPVSYAAVILVAVGGLFFAKLTWK